MNDLPGRPQLVERIDARARAAQRSGERFALLLLDLDAFTRIDSELARGEVDLLLAEVAERLREVADPDDVVARLGGDAFAILVHHVPHAAEAVALADRVRAALDRPFRAGHRAITLSACIGIAGGDGRTGGEALLREAAVARYYAKAAGTGRHVLFNHHLHEDIVRRLDLEEELRHAADRTDFTLVYQPIVSLRTGRPAALEALIRWHHARRGPVPPDAFITVAEESGLIVPLGAWLLRTACGHLADLTRCWPNDLDVNVNLSKRQLREPDVVEVVEAAVRESGLEPTRVKLEITETTIMESPERVRPVLERLKRFGFGLCMDDFGTGHSSLSCLHEFPIDVLKIDRAFVRNADERQDYAAVNQAIVDLAHNLHMTVVAEGVESAGQLAQLQSLECDYGQGYYFAAPMTVEETAVYLSGAG
jgi:diguanylate cyclase (GGDEF)-like protein